MKQYLAAMLISLGTINAAGATDMAPSQSMPLDIVDQRVQAMKDTGAAMRVLSKTVKGESAIGMLQEMAAKRIAETGKAVPALFPSGTDVETLGQGRTRAKANIWSDNAGFLKQAKAMEDAGNALIAAVQANDVAALEAALNLAGGSCGGCHKPYRAPKN